MKTPIKDTTITQSYACELIKEHGSANAAAFYLSENFEILSSRYEGKILSYARIRDILNRLVNMGISGREDTSRESRIEKLLHNHNVPLESINRIDNVKLGIWGVHAKDAEGNIQTSYLDKTQITIVPEAPVFPVVNCAEPRIIQYDRGPVIAKRVDQYVIISDTQIGFLQDPETKATVPIHDPKAIAVAKQITADIGPSKLAWIGDLMDWPFLSRWTQHDEYDAVNESIQAAYDHLCEFISASGRRLQEKIIIGGNHDIRPERFLLENNKKAMRVRRASDTSRWPVFSQPFLLRYDDLGIHYPGHYPGDHFYLLNELVLTHAPPKAKEFQASVIHGHTHHITRSTSVQHSSQGRKTYYNYDIGCLCQTGENPNPYSLVRTRVPSDRGRTDWSQGIAVVNVIDGEFFSVDQIAINDGRAIYQGQVYRVGS